MTRATSLRRTGHRPVASYARAALGSSDGCSGREGGPEFLDHLIQPIGGRAAGRAEILTGGVEQDDQVLPADPAAGAPPGLVERSVELLAVGTGLDLGEPATPYVDPPGCAVEV